MCARAALVNGPGVGVLVRVSAPNFLGLLTDGRVE
jgi:hypothetical protein